MTTFDGTNSVLVVGAHPDDEVLGVGGTMAKHVAAGDEVHVLIVTEGTTQQYDDADLIERKKEEAKACGDHLGIDSVRFGGLPDMRLDEVAHVEVNSVIEDACDEIEPDIVYTHSRSEINKDHRAVYDSTLVATRPFSGVSEILAYETPSSTNWTPPTGASFTPTAFVNVSSHLETKLQAFAEYKTELRDHPHPRSQEALRSIAKARGAAAGVPAAEAFKLCRGYY